MTGFSRTIGPILLLLLNVDGPLSLPTLGRSASAQPAFGNHSPNARTTARRYVHSLGDFLDHCRSHIERVGRLGMALRDAHPEFFGDVPPELLDAYLSIHDTEKVSPILSAGRPKSFARELYENYGLPKEARESQALRVLIDELNAVDAYEQNRFFAEHRLIDSNGKPGPLAQKLMRIERVVDSVDRALDAVSSEEFGHEMALASQWLKDPIERQLAEWLEQPGVHARFTSGSQFHEFRERCRPRVEELLRYFLTPRKR